VGKYSEQGPWLRKLVVSLNTEAFAREKRFAEVIVFAPEETMHRKNIQDAIADLRAAATAIPSKGSGPDFYNLYAYHVLSLDIPRAQCVPTHELADPAEVQAYLARERRTLADLRRISANDPPVVWIGARPGQVVRIHAPSETAGEAYDYCYVINN
jgi:DNA-directed RNA polymerase subunit H (RpoH/RPB5)